MKDQITILLTLFAVPPLRPRGTQMAMCIHTPKTYFGLYFFAFSESETYFEGCGQ
jgi:hypothetical protein